MACGANSTLILHPEGLSGIIFDLTGAESRTGGYVVNLDTLRLNEDRRLEIAYSEGPNVEGGEAISSSSPIVPITFSVVIYGTTLAAMIQKAEALLVAVTNVKGGTLEYKPDGLDAGVRSTFYHYEQSSPPKPRERWDRGPHDSGLYRMQVEVELQTQPFATSDPDNPVSVLNATTVYNQEDSVAGYVTIPAANIKGTEPALTQLRIRNLESGTWAAIQKLWLARRTEGTLANFSPVLEGGTPDTDSSIHWSTESDTTRRSNNYQRYAPPEAANDLWASLYYSISNIADHEGKAAIAVVCRSLAEGREDWDLKAALQVADVIVETDVKNVATVGMWTVCILGELDIPPTPVSADESYATKLYLYLRRNSGNEYNSIHIDFVQLLYVDEYPQQVTIPDGFTNSYRLLLENFERELCHVVDQSTLALEKVAQPLCPLLKLRPGGDNRVDFIWKRITGPFEDGFEDYEAWRWWKVADFETDEDWEYTGGDANFDTTYYVEGSRSAYVNSTTPAGEDLMSLDIPLTVFPEVGGVYIRISLYTVNIANMDSDGFLRISFNQGVGYFYYEWSKNSLSDGWDFKTVAQTGFSSSGSPSWDAIDSLEVLIDGGTSPGGNTRIYVDNWRIVKSDPNETGGIWDFIGGPGAIFAWQVCELDSTDKTLGCLDITAGVEYLALIHEEPPANIKYLAKVRAKRDDGEVGLVFRCADGTSGSEDMAAFFIDTANDELELRKWEAGSASDIVSAVSQTTAPDTDYWLGVWMIKHGVRCYFGTSKAAIWDDENEEFLVSARKFLTADSAFASGGALAEGQCGLLSIGTLGRFDDVELYGLAGHVPGDTISVEAKALYRSVYPFRE